LSGPSPAFSAAFDLHRAGRLAEAEAAYAVLPRDDPNIIDTVHLRGLALVALGRGEEGTACLERAVGLRPGSALFRSNLSIALERAGRRARATDVTRAGADLRLDGGDAAGAALWYRRVLALDPTDIRAIHDLAHASALLGDRAGAARGFGRAVVLRPDLDACRVRLVEALFVAGRFVEARDAAIAAIGCRPDDPALRLGLANSLKALGNPLAAEEGFRRVSTLDPASTVAWFNLGVTLADRHAHKEAIVAHRRAVRLNPRDSVGRYNLAHECLIAGRWDEGWAEFEHRLDDGLLVPERGRPRWRGEDPAGRTILFFGEQGLGDTLQFARYAPMIAARGARVVVECPRPLVRLMSRVEGVSAVYPPGGATEFDLILPMMSAPFVFGTTPATVPASIPYLRPDEADRRRFARRLPEGGARVGLVWAGEPRPDQPRLHLADKRRSVPLAEFAPLWGVPGVRFVSLQLGAARDQLRDLPSGAPIVDVMDDVRDFADTAALAVDLDLLVAVDTSVVHLAGGLGVPIWLLSRYDGCWRWLEGREDSPWYPGARVFAQTAPGDWAGVIARVAAALPEFVSSVANSRST